LIRVRTLRFRMMALFVVIVAVLLASSDFAFYLLVSHAVREQLDRELLVAAAPVARDIAAELNSHDVSELDAPDEYFQLLDRVGRVLQRSRNLRDTALRVELHTADLTQPYFQDFTDAQLGSLRVALIPIPLKPLLLRVAMPTREAEQVLSNFRAIGLVLLCFSLLVTAGVAALYVGRSLAPINELTRNAAETSSRVARAEARALWTPLVVRHPADELGRLAETFNNLFVSVDRALRQLRQFVSDASHELRTPLAVLQGETELVLSMPRGTDEYQSTLRVIDGELKKLARIVEGLFTLAMADAGELRLNRGPLYLNEVLEDACTLVEARAKAKRISIRRDLVEGVSYVGDEAFLHQLFLIFLDNAIKYSPPDTVITVSLITEPGSVQAKFQDQGFGIACEHRNHVFERFYRVVQAGADEAGSGGLGLAIAQAIATAHEGTIECQSTVGVGSLFSVSLPAARGRQEPLAAGEGIHSN
jgi:two-component system, OmpR family, sensor kinase